MTQEIESAVHGRSPSDEVLSSYPANNVSTIKALIDEFLRERHLRTLMDLVTYARGLEKDLKEARNGQ
jgi:hypothetical protein